MKLFRLALALVALCAFAGAPAQARFLQSDPVGYQDDPNLYTYVGNDPTNKTDPHGTQVQGAAIAGCAADVETGCVPGLVAGAALGCAASPGCRSAIGSLIHRNEAAPGEKKAGPRVNPDKQGKHDPEHKNFQPGKGEITHPDPQGLVDKGAGTGQQVGDKPVGEPGSKERVDFGEPIGTHVDPETGERSQTNVGIIHYGKEDVHVVPARPQTQNQQQTQTSTCGPASANDGTSSGCK